MSKLTKLPEGRTTSSSTEFIFDMTCRTLLRQVDFSEIQSILHAPGYLLICDKSVFELYTTRLNLSTAIPVLLLPAGEKHKNQTTVNRIHTWLFDHQANRSTRIIVIGGGTITDTAAYAVSVYKRGCRLIQIPTTLLAMVDAAIGGKTGINYRSFKNLLGTFYPADEVLIIPEFIASLLPKEIRNGLAEMLKMWFIDPELTLPHCDVKQLISSTQIYDYASAKLNICTRDIYDTGIRRLLNLGHTFGHALESRSSYRIAHGTAVARGMVIAAYISLKMGLIDNADYSEILSHIKQFGFSTDLQTILNPDLLSSLPAYLKQDKKNTSDKFTLILFTGLRKVNIFDNIDPKFITSLSAVASSSL